MNKISIIIPILNEVDAIHRLFLHIENAISKTIEYEIIIVDGGSTDGSQKAIQNHQKALLIHSEKGRAKQLNAGAKVASGSLLYFLHCDSFPPKKFDLHILEQVKKGNKAGCFRMKFDYSHPVLLVSQWFTRVNHILCRGGDQSLFVTKELFKEIDGYDEKCIIYEDNEIIKRLYQIGKFVVIPKYVITSARRYRENGVWRLQYHFTIIHLMHQFGFEINKLEKYYLQKIKS